MKKVLIILLLLPTIALTQTKEEFDFVAPIHENVVAVKKGNTWGFIDADGHIIIDFRNDLVLSKTNHGNYPMFMDNRCLISVKKEGILYFGYIDKTGKTVIEPEFLNAQNFSNNQALALAVIKEELGRNEILGKNVIAHRCFEVIIDENGDIKSYLNPKGVNVVLDKKSLKKPPKITSKIISKNLYAVLNENKKWIIIKIDN
ncbi:WG repeat-containing protein [Hyunsoonleella flava]|uniref:WG repeat-containing protein n=1 Tax=Hyunsoonleella flava TaxID=2527939 RepID=A0A4Q9FGN9_9FLAO|nr:WG repeat-containing protein [Hyunsoonleella flava]TBN04334.1 WG repeat-containing protein [Hyunsoonleella flava]